MKKLILLIFLILALPFLSVLTSCNHKTSAWKTMDSAESLMNSYPDSAYAILSTIDKGKLGGDEEKARYSLLMSMALDKNYIDTTTFDVLQPAIDFYLKNGSPDERLRTLYYQGRIFQNQGNEDSALISLLKVYELKEHIKDSLFLAHAIVAIGTIELKQYMVKQFIQYNLEAANLYKNIGREDFAINSFANSMGGYVMLEDKERADSILAICHQILQEHPDYAYYMQIPYISYIIEFGDLQELNSLCKNMEDVPLEPDDQLDFARAWSRLGENDRAFSILSEYEPSGSILDSLKYASVKTMILEGKGNYTDALKTYKEYSSMMERYQEYLMSGDLLFAEKKYKLELNNIKNLRDRDQIIWGAVCGIFTLLLIIVLLYHKYNLSKAKRILAETENENLKLEQDNLQKEKEKAELEKENLILEKTRLEDERDNLNDLLREQSGLTQSLRQIVKTRLSILNSLLAKEITKEENYAKPYRKWIDSIRKDKEEFKNSTREAFSVSHPKFMEYLVSHGLTLDEINYVCLHAIGLRGKDVGEYINLKRHYNVSSEIRKKLCIEEHETNLGLYIRRMMDDLDS